MVNLDCDDYFYDLNFLNSAVDRLESDNSLSLVFADYYEIDERTASKIAIKNRSLPFRLTDNEFFRKYAADQIVWNHNTIVYRLSLALAIGFYWHQKIPRNDWESFLRLIVGHNVGYIPLVAAAWVRHGRNETERPDIIKYSENFSLIKSVVDHAAPVFGERFVEWWQREMFWREARHASVGYIKCRDLSGWFTLLGKLRATRFSLFLRVLFDLSLWARYLLSLDPSLYLRVKRLRRSLIDRLY